MSDKICTSSHVMGDSDVACGRCGGSEQLSNNNLNTNMENDENKIEGAEFNAPAVDEKLEGDTVGSDVSSEPVAEPAPENAEAPADVDEKAPEESADVAPTE